MPQSHPTTADLEAFHALHMHLVSAAAISKSLGERLGIDLQDPLLALGPPPPPDHRHPHHLQQRNGAQQGHPQPSHHHLHHHDRDPRAEWHPDAQHIRLPPLRLPSPQQQHQRERERERERNVVQVDEYVKHRERERQGQGQGQGQGRSTTDEVHLPSLQLSFPSQTDNRGPRHYRVSEQAPPAAVDRETVWRPRPVSSTPILVNQNQNHKRSADHEYSPLLDGERELERSSRHERFGPQGRQEHSLRGEIGNGHRALDGMDVEMGVDADANGDGDGDGDGDDDRPPSISTMREHPHPHPHPSHNAHAPAHEYDRPSRSAQSNRHRPSPSHSHSHSEQRPTLERIAKFSNDEFYTPKKQQQSSNPHSHSHSHSLSQHVDSPHPELYVEPGQEFVNVEDSMMPMRSHPNQHGQQRGMTHFRPQPLAAAAEREQRERERGGLHGHGGHGHSDHRGERERERDSTVTTWNSPQAPSAIRPPSSSVPPSPGMMSKTTSHSMAQSDDLHHHHHHHNNPHSNPTEGAGSGSGSGSGGAPPPTSSSSSAVEIILSPLQDPPTVAEPKRRGRRAASPGGTVTAGTPAGGNSGGGSGSSGPRVRRPASAITLNAAGQRICRQCGQPGRYKDGRCIEKWGPGPAGPGTVCDRCRKRMKRIEQRSQVDDPAMIGGDPSKLIMVEGERPPIAMDMDSNLLQQQQQQAQASSSSGYNGDRETSSQSQSQTLLDANNEYGEREGDDITAQAQAQAQAQTQQWNKGIPATPLSYRPSSAAGDLSSSSIIRHISHPPSPAIAVKNEDMVSEGRHEHER